MRVIVADDSAKSAMRAWDEILAPTPIKIWGRLNDLESCGAGDVIILHGAGNSILDRLESIASERGLYVIVVSGTGFQRASKDPHVYFRRARVAVRADVKPDPHLGPCVRRFLRALREGRVDWSTIEPRAFPDEFFALAILLHGWLSHPERRTNIAAEWQALEAPVRAEWLGVMNQDDRFGEIFNDDFMAALTPESAQGILNTIESGT